MHSLQTSAVKVVVTPIKITEDSARNNKALLALPIFAQAEVNKFFKDFKENGKPMELFSVEEENEFNNNKKNKGATFSKGTVTGDLFPNELNNNKKNKGTVFSKTANLGDLFPKKIFVVHLEPLNAQIPKKFNQHCGIIIPVVRGSWAFVKAFSNMSGFSVSPNDYPEADPALAKLSIPGLVEKSYKLYSDMVSMATTSKKLDMDLMTDESWEQNLNTAVKEIIESRYKNLDPNLVATYCI